MSIFSNGGKFPVGSKPTIVSICPKRKNNGRSNHLVTNKRQVYVEGYSSIGHVKGYLVNPKTEQLQKSLCTFREYELA